MEQLTLGRQIHRVSNLLDRRINHIPLYFQGENLTYMQRMIIIFVHYRSRKGDVFQRDLEKAFSIRRSTASGLVQLMEKKGLLFRVPFAGDGRLKRICLTAEAEKLLGQIEENARQMEALLEQGLTKAQIQQLAQLLQRLEDNITCAQSSPLTDAATKGGIIHD